MGKKNIESNKGKSKRIWIYSIIGVLLVLTGVFLLSESQFDVNQIPNLFSEMKNMLFDKTENKVQIAEEMPAAKIKVYSEQTSVVEPDKITPSNLKSADGTYNAEGGANNLYDGDISTCSGSSSSWATLDAGELKTLSYIRYIPNTSSQIMGNTCVGTKFLASKDNKYFVELGTVNPDVNGDINLDWHTLEFSGYGEYRYFKVELSPYASFGEIEWVSDTGIIADENDKTDFSFMAFDAMEGFEGYTVLTIYNKDKILKCVETIDSDFKVGDYTKLEFSDIQLELGDYIRVITYDKQDMKMAVDLPLDYRFTEASSNLSVSNIYSDNMMFQADQELVVSGKGVCGSEVKAVIRNMDTGQEFSGSDIAKDISDWEINLGVFENGGNYELFISSEDEKLEFKNITFGDIWVFAGQSNMEFYLCGEKSGNELLNTKEGKKKSTTDKIRMINMYNIGYMGAAGEVENVPLNDWNEYWTELTPDRVSYMSAIAYYFSQGIKDRYDRNVGIISVAVGDTEINQWYPRGESFGKFTGDSGKLYNNRIYPFTKQKIKGILWYQGEADNYRTNMNAEEYSDAMAGLIDLYRQKWSSEDLPFYYVQLTRYETKDASEIREGQRIALQKVRNKKNVGMFGLLDIIGRYDQGEGCARTDIHPWQKEVVADRFLDYVGHDIYKDSEANTSGPVYQSKQKIDNTIVLTFKHKGKLKVMDKSQYADSVCEQKISASSTDTSILHEFWISDENGKFYPANARIENDKVVVWSDSVFNPTDVMYAWGAYPEMPNLTDDSGLPAVTFNTYNGSEVL